MGNYSGPMLSQGELQDFMIEKRYGVPGPDIRWPRTTILLCQISAETKSGELTLMRFPPLMRFNNIPSTGVHAEKVMIEYLSTILPPMCKVKLYMILSYSPCYNCSMDILNFRNNQILQKQLIEFSIEIKFSNFYNCHEAKHKTAIGLHKLIHNVVQLSVFCGINDWIWFIRDKFGLDPGLVAAHYTKQREYRELGDLCILQYIESYPAVRDLNDLCPFIAKLSVLFEL